MDEKINYEAEMDRLKQGGGNGLQWFSPKIGSYKIKILEEGKEYTSEWKASSSNEAKSIVKRRFTIEVNGEQFNWGVSIGSTPASLWGQLVVLGAYWHGLEGKEITLLVKEGRSHREYVIVEAIEVQQANKLKVEESKME